MTISPEKIAANKARDEKILRLHRRDGLDVVTIAERMGLNRAQVRLILRAAGVDTSRRKAKA